MKEMLAIFVGGGLGSLARFGMWKWLGQSLMNFPLGTFGANLLASLLLGFVAGIAFNKTDFNPVLKALIFTGFCGGFSTFSTFTGESFELLATDRIAWGLVYMGASLFVCIAGFGLAFWLGKSV